MKTPEHQLGVSLPQLILVLAFAIVITLVGSGGAFAQVAPPPPAPTPMGDVLCDVVYWVIYGNLGRGLAVLAVIIIGVGACLGKVSWGLALTIGIGISIVFGAPAIVTALVTSIAPLSLVGIVGCT